MKPKFKKVFKDISNGWTNMLIGKKAYSILWAITGLFLISLIVMFVALNNTFKQVIPPANGWTYKTNQVFPGEVKPQISNYKVQDNKKNASDIYDTYTKMETAMTKRDFKKEYNETAFLVNNETLGTKITAKTATSPYLVGYTPINSATGASAWSQKGQEYISPNNVRGWFDSSNKFEARNPIFAVDSWNTTPTTSAKTATTVTAIVGFVWSVVFSSAIITTVVVSKKAKGVNK